MDTSIKSEPKFPVLAINSDNGGISSCDSPDSMSNCYVHGVSVGAYYNLIIFDSNNNKWKIRNIERLEPKWKWIIDYFNPVSRRKYRLNWELIGQSSLEELKREVLQNFDEGNDLYSEMNVTIQSISNAKSTSDVIKRF